MDPNALNLEVRFCIPNDQEKHLPARRRHPAVLPAGAPIPRQDDIVYLSSSSAWGVRAVIHEWRSPTDLNVQVWLEYVGSSRQARVTGFSTTQ